jgi:hypothetical protein
VRKGDMPIDDHIAEARTVVGYEFRQATRLK